MKPSTLTELENKINDFDKAVDDTVLTGSYGQTVVEARALIDSIHKGPTNGNGYLDWSGDLLQEAEFNLARLAEYLAREESKADARASFAKDKFRQIFSREMQDIRKDWSLTRTKFSNAEVEDEARSKLSDLEDLVNVRYAEYRTLKNLVESIQRVMLCLTHRINELQSEKRFRT